MIKYFIIILLILQNVFAIENITLKISEIYPDPPGKDNSDLNNREFIEIYNYGENKIDLTDLEIQNSKNKSFKISDYAFINPKQFLIIYPSMKFSLKNNRYEKLSLFYKGYLIDDVSYSYSKESLSWTLVKSNWLLKKPSPGFDSNFKINSSAKNYLNKTKNKSEKLLNITDNTLNKAVYESNTLKQRRLGLYFFSITLILIIISLLIENGRKGNKSKSNN